MQPQSHQSFAPTSGAHRLPAALVIVAGIAAALQVGKVVIALPEVRAELGLDLAGAGWVVATFALLGVVSGIPVGAAATRFGDRRMLILGLVALAAGSAAGGLAPGPGVLLGSRVVEGAGNLAFVVAAPAVLNRIVAAKDRDLTFAIWAASFPIGIVTALLVGPTLDGWRQIWFANAALLGVMAGLLAMTVPRGEPNAARFSWRAVLRDAVQTVAAGGPLLLAGSFAIYTLQYFAVISFLPIVLVERLGVSLAAAGALIAVAVAANIPGNLAAGVLLGRGIPRWALLAVAASGMGVAGLGIFLPATPALLVLALCIAFFGVGGLLPASVIGGAPQLAPAPRLAPIAVGLLMQGNSLGVLIGPVVVGRVVDAAGWSAAAIPVTIAGVLGVTLALTLRRRRSRSREASRAGGAGAQTIPAEC